MKLSARADGSIRPANALATIALRIAVVQNRLGSRPLARWDGTWTLRETSSPLALGDSTAGTLRVLASRRDQGTVVWLDGREVFRSRAELQPIRPDELLIGRTPWRRRSVDKE